MSATGESMQPNSGTSLQATGEGQSSALEAGRSRSHSLNSLSNLARSLREPVAKSDDEEDSDEPQPKPRTGTFISSWSVLANTILGVGMLALPWATAQVGWIFAGILLASAAFFANCSLYLLACVAEEMGGENTTFYSVCTVVAPKLRHFVDFAIVVKCFGVATSYLQVIGQNLVPLLNPEPEDKLVVRFLVILVAVALVSPIAYRRRIGKTKFTNWLSLSGIMYVWILLLSYSIGNLCGSVSVYKQEGSSMGERTSFGPIGVIDILTTVPVFIFSFTCHQNMFPVANEIQDPSTKKLGYVASSAILTAVGAYSTVMFFGYAVFGRSIKENYLQAMLPHEPDAPSPLFIVKTGVIGGDILMSVSNALSFPLQSHPCRRSLTVLLSSCLGSTYEYPQVGERWMRRVLTTLILVGTITVATFVDDLGIVFSIVGTVGSNTICYIMPGFLYIQTFRGKPGTSQLVLRLATAQFIIGCFVLPTCLFSIFYKAGHGQDSSSTTITTTIAKMAAIA
jgi:amino acid permease